MGKSTISMAMFKCYVKLPEGIWNGWRKFKELHFRSFPCCGCPSVPWILTHSSSKLLVFFLTSFDRLNLGCVCRISFTNGVCFHVLGTRTHLFSVVVPSFLSGTNPNHNFYLAHPTESFAGTLQISDHPLDDIHRHLWNRVDSWEVCLNLILNPIYDSYDVICV